MRGLAGGARCSARVQLAVFHRRPLCTVDGTLAPHHVSGGLMAALGCDTTVAVCGPCRRADRALTSLQTLYLFISALGLKRFCGANLHNSLVLRRARRPGSLIQIWWGRLEMNTKDPQSVPLAQIITEISHGPLIELHWVWPLKHIMLYWITWWRNQN